MCVTVWLLCMSFSVCVTASVGSVFYCLWPNFWWRGMCCDLSFHPSCAVYFPCFSPFSLLNELNGWEAGSVCDLNVWSVACGIWWYLVRALPFLFSVVYSLCYSQWEAYFCVRGRLLLFLLAFILILNDMLPPSVVCVMSLSDSGLDFYSQHACLSPPYNISLIMLSLHIYSIIML